MTDRTQFESDDSAPLQFTDKKKSNSGDSSHIDMTPMVDVVFQLLTFFLLAVKRDNQEAVDVPVVANSTAVPEFESTFITIKPAKAGQVDPEVIIGDRQGKGDAVTPDMIKQAIEVGVQNNHANIIIKAEKMVREGDVAKVTRIVASVPGARLYVGVQGKE